MPFVYPLLFELLMYASPIWRGRRLIAALIMVIDGAIMAGIALSWKNWAASSVLLLGIIEAILIFRMFNLGRVIVGRMHPEYLRHASFRTSLQLISLTVFVITVFVLVYRVDLEKNTGDLWMFLAISQVFIAAILITVTLRNLSKTHRPKQESFYSNKELPTVTVAIPARNETANLTACLTAVLSSTYPKLEILVLDDCSQDKTSEIIKSFAHQGVRFVKGAEPKPHWLAKNQAYDRLAKEANGEFILFLGVDVRLSPQSIGLLVSSCLQKNKSMVSLLPVRVGGRVRDAFVQPLRYWWELALPRRMFNRPPVLSTCWMIDRSVLADLGGLSAVSHSIIPEGYFARELVKTDKYTFMRSDEELDVRTVKDLSAQFATALRLRYPQLRRRPENVLVLCVIQVSVLLAPFGLIVHGLVAGFSTYNWLAVVAAGGLVLNHLILVRVTNPANLLIAAINFPVAVAVDITITLISMYRYEFGYVDWKGRNVCIPVMHILPMSELSLTEDSGQK